MTKLALITSNQGKLREFRSELSRLDIEVTSTDESCEEIQADTIEEVVRYCLKDLGGRGVGNVIIDDSGLFIDSLGGFPGVYSSYVFRTLGCKGVLKLLEGKEDRSAHFSCCIGCILGSGENIVVTESVSGRIGTEEKGNQGFGFDPIFIPQEDQRTFAEMSIEEKNPISHRGKAIRAFAEMLKRKRGVR
ncbi:MAG: XTP/dITP diphosphatase [Methanomassiliicoccales archaeon]|nr:XTP/dITP diphosphatase [Methanomassiliicoccales archaeon]